MQASGLPECMPFVCTSAVWGQSGFLGHVSSCIPPAPRQARGVWQLTLDRSLGRLIHIWRPEITDGGGISCLLIWQKILAFHNTNQYWTPSCCIPDALWMWRIRAEMQMLPGLHKRYGRGRRISLPLRLMLFTQSLSWSLSASSGQPAWHPSCLDRTLLHCGSQRQPLLSLGDQPPLRSSAPVSHPVVSTPSTRHSREHTLHSDLATLLEWKGKKNMYTYILPWWLRR